ncbi:hypothetical protein J7E81_27860 [Bacillus sp. ISL-18]|uniref:hypothetical protein n=1 Tax=Bacillus sp. ISL-18 TaxID=2819118 RepID=UPI001BEB58A5|nr:hypothetical protein [Bacillus sp. ISL-18]MBT2658991.1 hypothetical protein [Bacillus sp. ISL-18]
MYPDKVVREMTGVSKSLLADLREEYIKYGLIKEFEHLNDTHIADLERVQQTRQDGKTVSQAIRKVVRERALKTLLQECKHGFEELHEMINRFEVKLERLEKFADRE